MTHNRSFKKDVRTRMLSTGETYMQARQFILNALDLPKTSTKFPPHSSIPYPYDNAYAWNEFPLGVDASGQVVTWDIKKYPNALTVGSAGSGKTVLHRTLLQHCMAHPDEWETFAIDLKGVDFNQSQDAATAQNIATNIRSAVDMLEKIHHEMEERFSYELSSAIAPTAPHYKTKILLVVNEVTFLLNTTPVYYENNAEEIELRQRARVIIEALVNRGRGSNIFVVLSAQTVDSPVLGRTILDRLTMRYVASQVNAPSSLLVLGNDHAVWTDRSVLGSAIVSFNGDEVHLRGFYTP